MPLDPVIVTDEELARQAQSGSLGSFEELVRRYETRLYRFLARACRNEADGADLTQETFVTAYTKLHRYDPSHSFATWLFIIARRKFIDHLRARRPDAESETDQLMDENSPAEQAAKREERSDLWKRIRAILSDVQFEAVWLRYVEEMSVEEIAGVLSRSRTHVKVILFRARAALTGALKIPGDRQWAADDSWPAKPMNSKGLNSKSLP